MAVHSRRRRSRLEQSRGRTRGRESRVGERDPRALVLGLGERVGVGLTFLFTGRGVGVHVGEGPR